MDLYKQDNIELQYINEVCIFLSNCGA